MIIVAGTIQIDPAKMESLSAAAAKAMAATHQEEGNLAYVFSADLETPGLIHVFEKWTGEEALGAHFGTPHMAEFTGQFGDFGITATSIKKYEVSGESDLM